jgi:maltose phosphorylase
MGEITITPFIDGDIMNKDSNYDEKFWDEVSKAIDTDNGYVQLRTKKTGFEVATAMKFTIEQDGKPVEFESNPIQKEKYIAAEIKLSC